MIITLDAELEAQLRDLAEGRGMETEAYVVAALKWVVTHIPEATDAIDTTLDLDADLTEEDIAAMHEGIRRGLEDEANGRTRPAEEFYAEMQAKYGLPIPRS